MFYIRPLATCIGIRFVWVIWVKIVYPQDANLKENKISIFSPIATALIGYKIGDEIEWIVPGGMTKIKIVDLIYQPEAAGDFDL